MPSCSQVGTSLAVALSEINACTSGADGVISVSSLSVGTGDGDGMKLQVMVMLLLLMIIRPLGESKK